MKYVTVILLIFLFSCNSKDSILNISVENFEKEKIDMKSIENNTASVFYFLAPECPLSQNYTKAINEINTEFKDKNVAFYGVFSGTVYTDEEVSNFIEEYSLKIIFLKDVDYKLSSAFNATITPEAFVLNSQGDILYSGKIDNWIESLGVKRQIVTEFFLKDAIQQYLDGERILVSKTEPVGCMLE